MSSHLPRLTCVSAATISFLATTTSAGISVHFWGGENQWHATCPTPEITEGGTDAIPPSVTWSLSPDAGMISALRTNYASWGGTAATYTWSNNLDALNGDLYFDWYKAFDVHSGATCLHGAQLTLHYVRAANDPVNVDFIQFFTETGNSGSRTNTVDPDPRDDNKPFYFTDTDVRSNFTHVPNLPGVVFGDTPYDSHPEVSPAAGSVTFKLQLASWGSNDHSITLHNYITWGYTWQCVPSPGSITMAVLGLLLVVPHRRR